MGKHSDVVSRSSKRKSVSDEEGSKHKTKKHKKSKELDKERESKKHRKKHKKDRNHDRKDESCSKKTQNSESSEDESFNIPINLMEQSKKMAPMTKEEWEKKQSVINRVYDESTGRHRLTKGTGEVLEEIVSKERHKAINQQATRGDGEFFQNTLNKMKT